MFVTNLIVLTFLQTLICVGAMYAADQDISINVVAFVYVTDLQPTADLFVDPGVSSFSQLLFDVSRDQVIVGAR